MAEFIWNSAPNGGTALNTQSLLVNTLKICTAIIHGKDANTK
jgi:hypothetical protein